MDGSNNGTDGAPSD